MPIRIDLAALARRLPISPLTRFAPAPTGFLHLGHVANAIFVWGIARALGGRVLLRLEDHDRSRCRPGYEAALLEDLEWLGLEPDLGTPAEFRQGPSSFRQSDSDPIYRATLAMLQELGLVYACECSRKTLAEGGAVWSPLGETSYSGRCRARGLAFGPGRGARLVMQPGEEAFQDALPGPQRQDPSRQCGDLLLRDRLGQWTYHLAVVVDDFRHGVDLVVRGEDLLPSTARQVRLARLIGRDQAPVYLHHPLIRKPDGRKLSKSDQDTGIRDLRAGSVTRSEVLGRAAVLAGIMEGFRPLEPNDLVGLFRE